MNELITCRFLIEFLDDYVEARLLPSERARFDEHLARCPACVRYLASYRGAMRAVARAARPAAVRPEDAPPELIAAILAARATPS
jgi:anti-sigma factor RsiW